MDPKLELERDYRRQVRRAYYKREEDFGSLQEYNDYLEEVEDIVEGLLNEATRKDTRERLEKLRTASEELTARNLRCSETKRLSPSVLDTLRRHHDSYLGPSCRAKQ